MTPAAHTRADRQGATHVTAARRSGETCSSAIPISESSR